METSFFDLRFLNDVSTLVSSPFSPALEEDISFLVWAYLSTPSYFIEQALFVAYYVPRPFKVLVIQR